MAGLPLTLKAEEMRVLVVGAGPVALRKIDRLLRAGAAVRVVAPEATDAVRALADEQRIDWRGQSFQSDDVDGTDLVIAATGVVEVDQAVASACRARRVLINCVDSLELSTVTFPSIVDREPVTVAISTDGTSPTLARYIRTRIETMLPNATGALARFFGARRARVKDAIDDVAGRQQFWDEVLASSVPDDVYRGDLTRADAAFDRLLGDGGPQTGLVSLVGAGPGDPDLLTLRALRTLQRAEVVLYDNLVSPGVLDLARRDAERIYVGKRRDFPSTRQESINELLVEHARAGRRVVRLKGGDPFIFGRGGEEIETLVELDIGFEVVPGITAALGCAAYAGIPLTHRDLAQSVRFVTGHLSDDRTNLEWPELAKPDQTLVIYMGLASIVRLCAELLAHGVDPRLPLAIVSRGTLADQAVIRTTLDGVADVVAEQDIKGPTTTIVGRVASLGMASSR